MLNMPDPALQFDGITKSFFGVKVLQEVSFVLESGRTLGLVGENGAGKSTLMNLLGGNLFPDDGRMMLAGQPYQPRAPRDAERHGVAFIHQELNLFSNLTIAENIFISGFPRRFSFLPFIHRRRIRERTRELLREVNLDQSPDTPVQRLSSGERQLVEVARALNQEASVIIFDEPTTSLTARESECLFAIIRRLQERGLAMIYISHNLGHVRELCHDLVVLRDGQVVGRGAAAEISVDRMVKLMVGREIEQFFPRREAKPGSEVLLEANRLTQRGVLRDVSFQLRRGEILGVSGLMGSGRSELARILFGLDPCRSGDIRLGGQRLNGLSPRQRLQRGLAFLTESRREEGLCLEASIADNLALASLPKHVRTWARWVAGRRLREELERIREAVRLTPGARFDQPVKTLSGGNQQKVVLAKWLLNDPQVLILDEPTRGIDVGAKSEIYGLINELAGRGQGVLMISSEMEELIGMCDRILVMNRGEISDVIEPRDYDRERILKAALQGKDLS